MNFVDVGIAGILIYSAVAGARRGLIKVLFDLITVIGSVIAAMFLRPSLTEWVLANTTLTPIYASLLSAVTVFVSSFLILAVVLNLMTRSMNAAFLGPLNWLGGLIVGVAKGVIVAIVVLVPMSFYSSSQVSQSQFGRPLGPLLASLRGQFLGDQSFDARAPEEITRTIRTFSELGDRLKRKDEN